MKTLLAPLVVFLGGLVCLQAGEIKGDLEKLQGAWVAVSLTELGKAIPEADIKDLEFTIAKDVYTVAEKGKTIAQYRITLDESKTPKEINFTHLIGDDKGKTEPGIYRFDKDQIKMCLDERKKGRPKVFEGKESDDYSVIVLKKKM